MIKFLVLLAILVFGIYILIYPNYFELFSDSSVYADIARNIVTGKGVTSNSVMPTFLNYVPLTSVGNWPPFYPAFYPLTIAASFLLFGVSDISVILISGTFFALTVPLLYLLTKKIYDGKIALVACLFYIFSPQLLNYAIAGMSETLFTFLLICGVYLLVSGRFSLWLGIVIALASLTKNQGLLYLPAFLFYLYLERKHKIKSLLACVLGFGIVIVINNTLFHRTSDYTNFSTNQLWTYLAIGTIRNNYDFNVLTPATFQLIASNADLVIKKLFINIYYLVQGLYSFTVIPITILYLLSFISFGKDQKSHYFKLFVACLLILFAIFHIFTLLDFRFFHPLLPLLFVCAAEVLVIFIKKFNLKNYKILISAFIFIFMIFPLLTSPGFGTSIQRSLQKPRKPGISRLVGNITKVNTELDAIVVTNDFGLIAWYGKRRTILFPTTRTDLLKIDKEIVPVDNLILSSQLFKPPFEKEWQDLIDHPKDFGNFRFVKTFDIKPEDNYYRIPAKVVLYEKIK